jgi:hypothetical protein
MKATRFLLLGLFIVSCGSAPDNSRLNDADMEAMRFPLGPDHSVTPGETCQKADTLRYPEKIPYCSRDVSSSEKNAIIRHYDKTFGYQIGSMNRSDFKIDHYIPLCMGGSNSSKNLWPQHKSVYEKTDPLEQKLCELMSAGKLLQKDAMEKIRRAKNNLDQVQAVQADIDDLIANRRFAPMAAY